MKRPRLQDMSVDGLVERFADSCLRQFKAELESSKGLARPLGHPSNCLKYNN